jgi:hypothetical protein
MSRATIAATGTTNTLVAAVAGKAIRVVEIQIIPANESTAAFGLYLQSSGGTALVGDATHSIPLDKTGVAGMQAWGMAPFYDRINQNGPLVGHIQTAVGESLQAICSGSQAIAGVIVYEIVG